MGGGRDVIAALANSDLWTQVGHEPFESGWMRAHLKDRRAEDMQVSGLCGTAGRIRSARGASARKGVGFKSPLRHALIYLRQVGLDGDSPWSADARRHRLFADGSEGQVEEAART
jgi:hypothetical protein